MKLKFLSTVAAAALGLGLAQLAPPNAGAASHKWASDAGGKQTPDGKQAVAPPTAGAISKKGSVDSGGKGTPPAASGAAPSAGAAAAKGSSDTGGKGTPLAAPAATPSAAGAAPMKGSSDAGAKGTLGVASRAPALLPKSDRKRAEGDPDDDDRKAGLSRPAQPQSRRDRADESPKERPLTGDRKW